ncbi:MAG: HAD-IIB family hydrolase [Treponema sp.]|jgi:HAD superfamily hydrolase (TIGR01484 family)|nr:HAD-IIB family hydrolase [Treponema sp.]
MKNIAEMSAVEAAGVKYILMDIDDTITHEGKLPASSYGALWKLKEAGLKVIPVTGRPAGWCDLIAREWPVDGVVGENGALAFREERTGGFPVLKAEYHPNAVRNDHPVLKKIRERALKEVPGLRDAKDQFARLFDIALDFAEEEPVLPLASAERVRDIALEEGAMAKISSIHVNIWMGKYDKLSMTEHFLADHFGWSQAGGDKEVVFVGDSPNDEPMFARFPLACAVANVEKYRDYIRRLPAFVASKECGDGFTEIAETILVKRKTGLN